jgi:6-phosphogluconolactonase (cycloisomerase 2 family)
VGWQTKADGTGSLYAQGKTFLMGSANVTLYALWSGGNAYVVNQTSGAAASISQYTIGPNGALTPMLTPTVATGGVNSQLITADPQGKYVYVSNVSSNTVSQFTIGADGSLTPMTPPTVLMGTGAGILYYPFSITVHPSGKWAYVANNQKGNVNQYTIGPNGTLTPMTVPAVAAGAYPDSITVAPSGKWAYVANGDANTVSQYTIDQTTGALTPMASPTVPSGQNAYTITIDPQSKYAYVTSYGKGTISQYNIDQSTGALTPMSVPTVASGGSTAISITIPPQGKFAYVSILTSTPNAVIAQFTIGADGALTPMSTPTVSAGGTAAVRIAVEASGKYAYATCGNSGWGSNTVAQYSIDQTTGALTLLNNATVLTGDSPNGIVTVGK